MRTRRPRWIFARPAIAIAAAVVACASVGAPGGAPRVVLDARPTADTATRLSAAQRRLNEILARVKSATNEKDRMGRDLAKLLGQLDQTRRDVESTTATLVDTEIRTELAQQAVDAQQRLVDQRAEDAYTDPVSPIDVILGATSLDDLQSRVSYLGAIAQSDQQVVAGLSASRQTLSAGIAQTEALQRQLDASKASLEDQAAKVTDELAQQQLVVASLDADVTQGRTLVKKLKDRLEKERALAALRAGSDPRVPPPLPGTQPVRALIKRDFGPQGQTKVDTAMCVASHESGFRPNAVNASSGAAGVFQFLPSTWASMSAAAGWQGSSALDADANVAVAAWTVGRYGWSAWFLDGPYCGF
jgi:peptidoglycan hydrolase CwlO-like protein